MNEVEYIEWFATPEEAVETARGLIYDGGDVFAIGSGSLGDSLSNEQIARIYAFWAKAKPRRT
jgi:hypothetical protein